MNVKLEIAYMMENAYQILLIVNLNILIMIIRNVFGYVMQGIMEIPILICVKNAAQLIAQIVQLAQKTNVQPAKTIIQIQQHKIANKNAHKDTILMIVRIFVINVKINI